MITHQNMFRIWSRLACYGIVLVYSGSCGILSSGWSSRTLHVSLCTSFGDTAGRFSPSTLLSPASYHFTIAPYSLISYPLIGQWVYMEPRSTIMQSPSTLTINNCLFVQANDPRESSPPRRLWIYFVEVWMFVCVFFCFSCHLEALQRAR
jgi:hypothetical protein